VKFLIFLLIVTSINSFCQTTSSVKDYFFTYEGENSFDSSLPLFDIHIGAGVVPGGRIGARYLFVENISLELAYGADVVNFFGLSDPNTRYTLGLNYHLSNSIAAITLLVTYADYPNFDYRKLFISPNFGIIQIRKSGIQIFIRAGISIILQNDNPTRDWKYEDFGGNIDVGVSYNF
jgi:hypothetical protein